MKSETRTQTKPSETDTKSKPPGYKFHIPRSMRPHRKPVITNQVSFDDDDDAESIDGRYLLIQRQFEFPDDDSYYLESDDSRLCGHVKVRAATLSSEFLSIDLLTDEWTTLRIRYGVSQNDFKEFERIVRIMFEDKVFSLD